MKRLALCALAATSLLLAQSCKKDPVEPKPAPTPEQLLTAGAWHLTGTTLDPAIRSTSGVLITDLFPYLKTCYTNNTLLYLSGGTLRIDEGPTKCNDQDAQIAAGTWTLTKSGSDTSLSVTESNYTIAYKVLNLSETELKMTYREDLTNTGVLNTVTVTYAR